MLGEPRFLKKQRFNAIEKLVGIFELFPSSASETGVISRQRYGQPLEK